MELANHKQKIDWNIINYVVSIFQHFILFFFFKVNRRPKISFKAFKPYPFVLNLTNGTLWCEGRSITENVTEPYPVFVEMVFIRNGKSIKSIFKDQRLSITLYSDSINVTNIVPSDKFECNVLAVAAPCNVAYLQYKVLGKFNGINHSYN